MGKGSFSGFVLHVVDRLLIDLIRKSNPRRRDPEAEKTHLRLVSTDDVLDMPSQDPSPERIVLNNEAERLLDAAAKVLRSSMAKLSVEEQLYMRIALSADSALPAREIAGLMQYPVDEVYKLKRRVMQRLERELEVHPDVKNWLSSV